MKLNLQKESERLKKEYCKDKIENSGKQKNIIPVAVKDSLIMLLIFAACTLVGLLFQKLHFTDTNIVTVYMLGVLLTSILTDGYVYSISGSILSVFLFCFFLTEPRMSFRTYAVGYPVTFVIMLLSSVLTGTLAAKLKMHVRLSEQLALENSKNAIEKEKIAVRAKNEQLRADLLRAISHDLRTPLCSISGNADMLLCNGERLDEETKRQIYRDIYDDSEWLTGVVENLLSITRIQDGKLKFRFSDQLLDEVIAEARRHISRKNTEHPIQIECEELILARMDVRLIIQVLINLIDNAIKYTPPGSIIQVQGIKRDGKAQICVKDNGPGIPDEMKPHVFEMFYTGKNTVADSHRSLGLGLALCRSIIEAHGGILSLTDNLPHGCIFTFTLPLSEVQLHE